MPRRFLVTVVFSVWFAAANGQNQHPELRVLIPNIMPLPWFPNIPVLQRPNETAQEFACFYVSLCESVEFFRIRTPHSAWVVFRAISVGRNVFNHAYPMIITSSTDDRFYGLVSTDHRDALRHSDGSRNVGAPSIMRLNVQHMNLPVLHRSSTVAHEACHAVRAQYGIMAPGNDALVRFGGDMNITMSLGHLLEEFTVAGIEPDPYSDSMPCATENNFRYHAGLPFVRDYGGLSLQAFHQIQRDAAIYRDIRATVATPWYVLTFQR